MEKMGYGSAHQIGRTEAEQPMSLIERDDELATLRATLGAAMAGRGRCALVSGVAATGKSALLQAFTDHALQVGAVTVTAITSRMERCLPLGVIGQLIRDAPLIGEERTRALALLDDGVRSVMSLPWEHETEQQIEPQVVHLLCSILLELAEKQPLAVVVDDVHHSDRASLICLAYLSRRARFARIAVVLTECDHGRYTDGTFQAELRQPLWEKIELNHLTRSGVAAMAAGRVGAEAGKRFAGDWYALSGGNPRLVAALADDHRDFVRFAENREPDTVVVGTEYGRAVLACLSGGDDQTLQVAQGLAILDDAELLDQLLGLGADVVGRELQTLTATGLLAGGRYRHEVAGRAIVEEMGAERSAKLHRRAAEVAYGAGAPPDVIAGHLRWTEPLDVPWGVTILEQAAVHALRGGSTEAAVSFLRRAARECADDEQRARITSMLVRAEWRLNPGAAAAHLTALIDAAHRGDLRDDDAVALVRALLWHGRTESARSVLDHLGKSAGPELVATRLWLRVTHPDLLTHLRQPPREEGLAAVTSVALSRRLESALALAESVTQGLGPKELDTVERILDGSHLDEMSLETVENGLLALAYGGHPDRAASWCGRFVGEAASRQTPSRSARLLAVRAEVAFRQGDMPAAERYARKALEIIPLSGWGVAVGGPLSALVRALTAMGRYDEAREQLDRPVPEAMLQSRYGLHYLHARGRHSLATGYPALALRDFHLCGEMMSGWDVDTPWFIPWRTDAAEACLRMNRPEEARQLAQAHLDRCAPRNPQGQGVALRLLAAVSAAELRPALLRQSAEFLQVAGDRYELARSLNDLAVVYEELGEHRRAGIIVNRARAAADECGTVHLHRTMPEGAEPGLPASDKWIRRLSGAERRVAALAAAGYTNSEIAAKLFISISTVEQHLTRTYKKLSVSGREGLPANLGLPAQQAAWPADGSAHERMQEVAGSHG
ncbi:helix-turn-helix transcriptional regulator [Rhizohabitans arisaemae]|uniref:helix-turn-helix transcriptional regulator n=1 Tax=Rhizohabitans arisaemae TaxID=2720610 RepID=UPI0024B0599E|nr:LuxR family transcriptional regulator [Rhizohabitans arisaemae]